MPLDCLSKISTVTTHVHVFVDGKSVHYIGFIFDDNDSKHARIILTCSKAVCNHEGKPLVDHNICT